MPSSRQPSSGPAPRYRVLIMSPDPVAAALVGALVETLGYEVRFHAAPEDLTDTLRRERPDVAMLDVNASFEQHLAIIQESDHARFPVVKGGMDNLLGVINARQWLSRTLQGGSRNLAEQPLQAPLYVPETVTGMELLDNFRSSDVQMAFVIDEYGQMQGIVTLQDLVEAITGEFRPRDPQTSWAVEREDSSWLLDGHIPVPELKDRLHLSSVPEEERGRYHTLSGMLMLLTGRLPKIVDWVEWEDWRLEIVDMDGKTIDKVLATRRPEPTGAHDPADT